MVTVEPIMIIIIIRTKIRRRGFWQFEAALLLASVRALTPKISTLKDQGAYKFDNIGFRV